MRRTLEGIVWRMASTVRLLMGHMISDLRSTISGDKAKQIMASPSRVNFLRTSLVENKQ